MTKNEHRNDYKLFLVTRLSTTAQQLIDNADDACLQVEFCRRFEALFYDGIKVKVFRRRTESYDVWEMLKEISPPHLIREIMELETVKSELGRTRAWIRITINESSLPNYLILICDYNLLSKYYNNSTILLDTILMDSVKRSVLLVTSNAIKVLFNPDSFDFEVAPSAISLAIVKKPSSSTISPPNNNFDKIIGLTSNTEIPSTSQQYDNACSSNPSICLPSNNLSNYNLSSNCSSNNLSSHNLSSNNSIQATCSNISQLSDVSNKEYSSLLSSPEPLWIISPNSSDTSDSVIIQVQTQLVEKDPIQVYQDYHNLEKLKPLESPNIPENLPENYSTLNNDESLDRRQSDTGYHSDRASKDSDNLDPSEVANVEEIVPQIINISAESRSPELSPPITAQYTEQVPTPKRSSSEPYITTSQNKAITTENEAITTENELISTPIRSSSLKKIFPTSTPSDNNQTDEDGRTSHHDTNTALNFNSLDSNDVNSSINSRSSPDILTDIDLEKSIESKYSLAEEILVEEIMADDQPLLSIPDEINENTPPDILTNIDETGQDQVFYSLNESNASPSSLPEVLLASEVTDLTVYKEQRGSPMTDVRMMMKRPKGNSLLRDSSSDLSVDMIPDTPLLISETKHLTSLYHDNIFLIETQQAKTLGPHLKDDHVFDEDCSARSAESLPESEHSAVSNSSIYSSTSGDNILLLASTSVQGEEEEEEEEEGEEEEDGEVFEETKSIPVCSTEVKSIPVASSTPQDSEPLSSSLYKLFSRSLPKPNAIDTSKLSEINSAVSDDIPLSPDLPVSPSCKRGYMSHISGASQATVNAGVATYESAAAWLSLSKDMLWWLQKRVLSQHEHCQCSPPRSPDIMKSCSTTSSLLELCTEQCPCCNAIVIDYNKPQKSDSEIVLSRSCPPFTTSGSKDFELFDKSGLKTRNTLSDDSANYFNLDILYNPAPTVQQIQEAIEEEKRLLQLALTDEEKKTHIDILVKLRLKVQSLEEKRREENGVDELVVMGHIFTSTTRPSGYCDKCNGPIYQRLSTAVTCNACHVLVHKSCLSEIKRNCALQNTADLHLITDICPDHGLNEQSYSCWDCQINIGYTKSKVHQCDYNGRYYCTSCHKKTLAPVPARILQNWDFKPRALSAQSIDILMYLNPKETLNLEQVNPHLFTMIPALDQIRTLREDFILYRAHFIQCEHAMKDRLLLKLQPRQHFVESSKLYTIQDLVDLNSGVLLKEVQEIHSVFQKHHQECERCTKHRFSCIVCNTAPQIDPFNKVDFSAASCQYCHGVYHRACFNSLDCCQYCNCTLVLS